MDAHTAELLIYRAMVQLEEDGDLEAAATTLQEAIEVATLAGRKVELIRGKALLGEVLMNSGREEEAIDEFSEVLTLGRVFDGTEDLAEEIAAAQEGLERLKAVGEPEVSTEMLQGELRENDPERDRN
jgi:tetratricopeptide (TPR) repeat protein